MRVCFFTNEKPRERILSDVFLRGLAAHGDEGEIRRLDGTAQVADGCEVACMIGVKSRAVCDANWRAGVHTLYFDKGYLRHRADSPVRIWEYWRVAVDGHHPTRTLMKVARPHDRLDALGLEMRPWRSEGEHIVIAGSSAKYHEFCGLPEPTAYARRLVRKLKGSGRPIVYRPKPSWRDAVPIKGARFSRGPETIDDVLAGTHALVTHGSNACFEAVLAGVPCIVLGEAVAAPISSMDLDDIETPRLASEAERRQWLANLAYCQWTMTEIESGEAWATIRPQIYG